MAPNRSTSITVIAAVANPSATMKGTATEGPSEILGDERSRGRSSRR